MHPAHGARITWNSFNDTMSMNLQDKHEKTGQLMLYKYGWFHEPAGLPRPAGSLPPAEDNMLDADASDEAGPLLPEGSPRPVDPAVATP